MTLTARPGVPLTAAEIEALALTADGYTSHQIAHRLGITRSAVLDRTAAARTKLRARTTTHAVVLAYRTGQLGLASGADRLTAARALVQQLHAILDQPRRAA
ncbi:LuxR C-terminal-related transcriptional regulator [Kitasatospora sp. NPDC056531]|uniref:LuxR C-terminal-related transcriptional regulator n=1 Tax=Kitasatospora sp. NPDC056531 TaxID=3345856 RepID=UPI00368A7CE9